MAKDTKKKLELVDDKQVIDTMKMVLGTPKWQLPQEFQVIKLDKIIVDLEHQPRESTDGTRLVSSISNVGLQEPLEVQLVKDGNTKSYLVLCGNCRYDAIQKIKVNDKPKFKFLFSDGVPCRVYTKLTDKEAMVIRMDHSLDTTKELLTSKIEAYNACCSLFQVGYKEIEVAAICGELIASIFSPKTQLVERRQEIANASSDKERISIMFQWQRGNIQYLKVLSNAPDCLIEHWKAQQHGEKGLTRKDYNALGKLHLKEIEDDMAMGEQMVGYNRTTPGTEFKSAWKEALDNMGKKKSTSESAESVLKASELKDICKAAQSKGIRAMFLAASGNVAARKMIVPTDAAMLLLEQARDIDATSVDAFIQDVIVNGVIGDIKSILKSARS